MFATRSTLLAAVVLVAGAGCDSHSMHIQDDHAAADYQCNNEYNRANGIPGCWVELYSESGFTGHCVRIFGPMEIPNMDFEAVSELDGDVESMRVGPLARVELFNDEDFGDTRQEFVSGSMVADMDDVMVDDDTESLRIHLSGH